MLSREQKSVNNTVVIMQPGYLPWIGFFDLLLRCDIFVIYDDVQYDKGGWRNRNRIKTKNGPIWLTVPVVIPNGLNTKINEVRIDRKSHWKKKHLKSLKQNYNKSPYFDMYFSKIDHVLTGIGDSLLECNVELIKLLAELIGIKRKIIFSSQLNIKENDRILRLIKIVKYFDADSFYEPAGGRAYFRNKDLHLFEKEGILLEFQNIVPPAYKQNYLPFVPNLSVVDLLFNEGPDSLKIINTCSIKKERELKS